MRALSAALLAASLLLAPAARADRDLYVRGTADGAMVYIPDHVAPRTEILMPRADMVIIVAHGAKLRTDTFYPQAWWVESVRVVGPELLGADESRIVLDLSTSAAQPVVIDRGTSTEVVLSGLAPWFTPPTAFEQSATASGGQLPAQLPPAPSEAAAAPPRRAAVPSRPPAPEMTAPPPAPQSRRAPAPRSEPPPPASHEHLPAPAGPAPAGMVVVPAGEFTMGTPIGMGFEDESPEHRVWLPTFSLDTREVTVGEFQRSPQSLPRQPEWNWGADQPVVNVTWHEAVEYCRWAGKRLPTEAEWEKAARGPEGLRFAWGNRWNVARANSGEDGDGHGHAAPVGSFPEGASPYGALDLTGNVWEWTADWYGANYYEDSPSQSPPGPSRGTYRVTRGGSFDGESSFNVRTAVRQPLKGSARRDNVGFRCAAD